MTDTTCTLDLHKWIIRFCFIIGSGYYLYFAPVLINQTFQEHTFQKASTFNNYDIKKYAHYAGKFQMYSYLSGAICLLVLDIPVMSNEDLSQEKLNNYEGYRRYQQGKLYWLLHLLLYNSFAILSMLHSLTMKKLYGSLNNTFVDPDLVIKARKKHGTKLKNMIYVIVPTVVILREEAFGLQTLIKTVPACVVVCHQYK